MQLQSQSVTNHFVTLLNLHKPTTKSQFRPPKRSTINRIVLKCSISTVSEPLTSVSSDKPVPAEVSRTIMELSSVGTLSTLTHEGWPLGVGVRFAVDEFGTPVLCFNRPFNGDKRSTLHVQLEQFGLRTPQCTIQGSVDKPVDEVILKRLHSEWKKRFGEVVNEESLYVVNVDRVLQMEDFMEEGMWVSLSDYRDASPDPLRDIAVGIVNEINANNVEDILRFCNVYVDSDFQVTEAKMIWMDRLGFDLRLFSSPRGAFDVRIPFPREVTDAKGAKSSFNCMAQLAWEVEKSYHPVDFEKVKQLKPVTQVS